MAMTKRRFIALGGAALGALALGRWTFASPPVVLPVRTFGGVPGMKKAMVAYASRCGATAEVAEAVGKALRETGEFAVDVRPVDKVDTLQGYDAVVVGSAVRFGHWLPEGVAFLKRYGDDLSKRPTACFLTCARLHQKTPESTRETEAVVSRLKEAVPSLDPLSFGLFAGKVDPRKLSLFHRLIQRMVKMPSGDWRDWDAIGRWARDAASGLARAVSDSA